MTLMDKFIDVKKRMSTLENSSKNQRILRRTDLSQAEYSIVRYCDSLESLFKSLAMEQSEEEEILSAISFEFI